MEWTAPAVSKSLRKFRRICDSPRALEKASPSLTRRHARLTRRPRPSSLALLRGVLHGLPDRRLERGILHGRRRGLGSLRCGLRRSGLGLDLRRESLGNIKAEQQSALNEDRADEEYHPDNRDAGEGILKYWLVWADLNKDGRLNERPWQSTAVTLARKHGVPILPVNVRSRNSGLFYWFANWNTELRDMTVFHVKLKSGDVIRRTHRFEGVIPNMERRYHETDSGMVREHLQRYLRTRDERNAVIARREGHGTIERNIERADPIWVLQHQLP